MNELNTFLAYMVGLILEAVLWVWEHPVRRDMVILSIIPSILLMVFTVSTVRTIVRALTHKR